MGQKEIQKRHNSIWSFFKPWRCSSNFFGRSSGFTLIELLTVVGIIGILIIGALTIIDPSAQFQKANDTRRKADLSQIQKSLETYFQDHGKYPQSSAQYKIVNNGNEVDWGSTTFSPYISLLPEDPRPFQRNYVYYSASSWQSYYLYASLERSNDLQLCAKGIPCASLSTNGISANACGQTCNFGVSSSNVSP